MNTCDMGLLGIAPSGPYSCSRARRQHTLWTSTTERPNVGTGSITPAWKTNRQHVTRVLPKDPTVSGKTAIGLPKTERFSRVPVLRVVNLDRRKPDSCKLSAYAANIHSQFGEDGIISQVFKIIEPKTRWCVEFGAWDGLHLSNTCHLVRDQGWNGVLIEGSAEKFADLQNNFSGTPNACLIHAIVGFERGKNALDDVLSRTGIPRAFDLASIDIDGNDYHIWHSLIKYRPRVVVIEFNPTVPNDVVFVQDKDMAVHQGCSLAALIELGKRKNYELVATTACNAIFVDSSEFSKFEIDDNSIDAMRENVIGRIFHCYDGTIYTKMRPLQWAGRGPSRPGIDVFQLLTPEQRVFYDLVAEDVDPKVEE